MARIRTLKPEFWSDEKLSECSLSARLLFIGLISFADDEGRLECSPARLRMQIFPCGSVKPQQLTEWLVALTERSLIRRYVVDKREYIDIPNFKKHQKINRPTPSKLPAAPCGITEDSMSPHGALTHGLDPDPDWNGRDLKDCAPAGAPVTTGAKRSSPKTQIGDRALTDELRTYATAKVPDIDADATFEQFRDHHLKLASTFADWDAAWRTWIQNIATKGFSYVRRARGDVEASQPILTPAEWRAQEAAKRAARA
jgi:hypothetical protein